MALVPHWRDNIKPWKPFWRPFGEIGSFTRSVSQSVNSHGQVRRYCDPFKVTLLTKNVRTFLKLSTLFLFIAAFFPLAPCYKMERDGHVIPYLFDYKPISAISRDPKLWTCWLGITRTKNKSKTPGYKPRPIHCYKTELLTTGKPYIFGKKLTLIVINKA